MAQNENVAVIENAVAQMNSGNLEGYLEMYSDDLTLHGYPPGVEGKAGVSEFYRAFAKALPDLQLAAEDVVEDGDKVAAFDVPRAFDRFDSVDCRGLLRDHLRPDDHGLLGRGRHRCLAARVA